MRMRNRLSPVMDMSPRPEEAENDMKQPPIDTNNVVSMIHMLADALNKTSREQNEILERLQV